MNNKIDYTGKCYKGMIAQTDYITGYVKVEGVYKDELHTDLDLGTKYVAKIISISNNELPCLNIREVGLTEDRLQSEGFDWEEIEVSEFERVESIIEESIDKILEVIE